MSTDTRHGVCRASEAGGEKDVEKDWGKGGPMISTYPHINGGEESGGLFVSIDSVLIDDIRSCGVG